MYQNIYIHRDGPKQDVYLWDDEEGLVKFPFKKFHYAYVKDPFGEHISIYGDKLRKVKTWKKEQDVLEGDVPAETRVLSDLYLDDDNISKNHVIGFVDIEVDSEGGFANIETANKEITDIAFYNSVDEKYVVFSLDHNNQLTLEKTEDRTVVPFQNEKDMLKMFLEWYKKQKFTILTGWNSAGFDIPYLYRRLRVVLGEERAGELSPIGIVEWSNRKERYKIAGVSSLDYLEMYKKFRVGHPQPNYRLGTIGLDEVGIDKVEYDGSLDQFRKEDLRKFIEYNITDVKILVELDKKFRYIELAQNICHSGHVPYEDYMFNSRTIEGTILVYLHRKNIIAPNKPVGGREEMDRREEENEEGFEGAYVKPPVVGLHEWVYSLDLQSLYPSVIMSLNISPETKAGKITNWDVDKYLNDEIDLYHLEISDQSASMTKQKFEEMMNELKLSISSNGILYEKERTGIIPEILDVWFSKRKEYQKLKGEYSEKGNKKLEDYYDGLQATQKVFLNSIYGVLGLPVFRFYDLDNAEAVTLSSQTIIKSSAKKIQSLYESATKETDKDYVIYQDTDSCYVSAKPLIDIQNSLIDEKMFTIQMARYVEEKLNEYYNDLSKEVFYIDTHRFVIRGEAVAETGFWLAKKKYALLKVYDLEKNSDVNRKMSAKGLDVVRSSFPPAFRDFMKEFMSMILNKKTKNEVDQKILEFKSQIEGIDYKKIARNTSVQNIEKYDIPNETGFIKHKNGTPLHVKSAITYNRLLKRENISHIYPPIHSGEKIKYVYLKSNPLQIQAMAFKGVRDPKEVIDIITKYIDVEKLYDAELKKKLEDFYSAMGWGLISTDVNQNAEEFFSFT